MKFGENFGKWQNYVHYLLLTIGLIVIHHLVIKDALEHTYGTIILMFIGIYMTIFILDSVIHAIFWFAPKKWRWRD